MYFCRFFSLLVTIFLIRVNFLATRERLFRCSMRLGKNTKRQPGFSQEWVIITLLENDDANLQTSVIIMLFWKTITLI